MELEFKPDFEAVKDRWRHFWNREAWRRPLIHAVVPKDPAKPLPWDRYPMNLNYYRACTGDWAGVFADIDYWMQYALYPAEAIPMFGPDFGPDQFTAFLGATLRFSENSPGTNWVEPIVDDWDKFEFRLDPQNPTWTSFLEYSRQMAAHGHGRYLVSVCDLHSNGDTLSALRGPERLCMDLLLAPEQVERAMTAARRLFPPVYDALYQAGGMGGENGSIGWAPCWCDGKFATIQCDFICMVSPETARQTIIPALDEEASFLDHCVYHLDGPGALPHLDDILSIKKIDAIQWVSGAGQAPMWQWLDVLKKIQRAGKGLWLYDLDTEQAKQVFKELDPTSVVYTVNAQTAAQVDEFAAWMERNM